MSIKFIELHYPPESGGSSGDMSRDDIYEFLSDDTDNKPDVIQLEDDKKDDKEDDEKPSKEKTKKPKEADEDSEEDTERIKGKSKEDEDEETDELKELEEELEEPTENQLELVAPVPRREILAKYPKLFKEFPYLEKAYYREQQFTEINPTIEDARETKMKAETLDNFERDLIDGNTETILKAVKSENPKSFNKIVDDYLPALARIDKDAHLHVVGNTIKHTIQAMVAEARVSGNEVLQNAAQILNQFVFGSSNFSPPTNLSSRTEQQNPRENEITQRERDFEKKKFEDANNNINERVNSTYRATIEAHIDPKGSMSDFVKRHATREAMDNIQTLMSKDTRFKVLVDKLWEKAAQSDYSKSAMKNINDAFIFKARTLLPSVIKKARNEALRGTGKRVVEDSDDNDREETRRSPARERSRPEKSDRNKIPEGMSSLDYLMQD
jgi:hypothetical protein